MLDKYQHFKKLSKTEGCSFYDAEDRTSMQNVLLKRLQQKSTWDQLLTNRNLQYMTKVKFTPKMLQIFKKKGFYFIVFQKPSGPPLSEPQQIGKIPLNRFYSMFFDLCQNCVQLKQQSPQMYILPQWLFLNRNTIKIGHFQPFFSTDGEDGNKHVFMYNLQKSMHSSLNGKALAQSDVLTFQRRQSLIFNLGTIGYQLLTGKKATTATTQQQYAAQIAQLEGQVYKRIQKITKDQKLAQMITKMIKQDPFDCPTLTQIYNFTKRKNNQYSPKDANNPTVEFDMQKIQLTDKYNQSPTKKRFLRPCCKTTQNQQVDVELQKKGHLTLAYVKRDAHNHTRNRSFLPQIQYNKSRYRSKDTFGSKPTMLRSEGDLRFKEI